MDTLLNPASTDAGRRRPLPRCGIRVAMVLALVSASTAWYYMQAAGKVVDRLHPDALKGVPDPGWISLLWAVLPWLPTYCRWCFSRRAARHSSAAGAGTAAGLFATFLMLFAWYGDGIVSASSALSRAIFLPDCDLSDRSSCDRHLGGHRSLFGPERRIGSYLARAAAGATFVCTTSGLGSIRSASIEFHRAYQQQKQEDEFYGHRPRPVGARQNLVYLASCLFQNHFVHPQASYPRAINPQTRWGCDTKFAANTVPDFKLSYAPQTNPITGNVLDFQLVAVPKKKGVARPESLDDRSAWNRLRGGTLVK